MRDQPVDAAGRHLRLHQRFVGDFFQHGHGQLEDGRAVHVQEFLVDAAVGRVRRAAQDVAVAAVRMQLDRQHPRLLGGRQHDGAGAVAEQHAGGAVVEVEDAGEDFGADHQHVLRMAGLDEGVARRQCVDEAAAHGAQVERGAVVAHAELVLDDARGAGEAAEEVRRGRGDDDQVDLVGVQPGRVERHAGRVDGQVGGVLVGSSVVAGGDAAAGRDPLVRGLDARGGQLRRQLVVGDALCGQVAARADNFAVSHC